ncbi:hypothetical protein OCD65_27990 [Bacillus paranthracis]|uniref:hypothetical protein n=1 Tax=Bacillus cereus group TaxID=86661 RepID=UPI001F563EB7|nr:MULTISPECIES: hypothetical protein [Bacillus cereus group]MCU5020523.1 hypothetical protein [Bacillus paranthracis]
MLVDKIKHVDDVTKKKFYRELTTGLLELFSQDFFSSEAELQQAFYSVSKEDKQSYREYLNELLQGIAPDGIELTWKDLKKLTHKRWRLCRVCGEPFLTTDLKNKTRICNMRDYKRYRVGNETREGKFFKGTLQGYSECFMKGKAILERDRMREKKANERQSIA